MTGSAGRGISRRALGRGVLVGLSAAIGVGVLDGCSGIPHAGAVVDVTKNPSPTVQDTLAVPRVGADPQDIIRTFIDVIGKISPDNSTGPAVIAARKFLTADAVKSWPAADSKIVVLSDDIGPRLTKGDPDKDQEVEVTLNGTPLGSIDKTGVYVQAANTSYTFVFQLSKSGGIWVIANPPADLPVLNRDFSNAFVLRSVYFLDFSATVVVPDQRYVPQDAKQRLAKMMDLLLAGPASTLVHNPAVVRNQLAGMELRSNVVTDETATTVDLQLVRGTRAATSKLSATELRGLAAQVVFTLAGADIPGPIVITLGGKVLEDGITQYLASTVAPFGPDQKPSSTTPTDKITSDPFYVDTEGAIVDLLDRIPIWGTAGEGILNVSTAVMSAATGVVAVKAPNCIGGFELLIGRPLAHQELQRVQNADDLSSPSLNRTGDTVWIVQNGNAKKPEIYQISVQAGDSANAGASTSRVTIGAPELVGKQVTALAVSPDGVRVAVLADGMLHIGSIAHSTPDAGESSGAGPTGGTTVPSLVDFRVLNPTITGVTDVVVFGNSTTLLVVADTPSSKYNKGIVRVSIDGSKRDYATSANLISSIQSVAVNGDGTLYAESDGRIYQLNGAFTTGSWQTPESAAGTVLFGRSPFYPT